MTTTTLSRGRSRRLGFLLFVVTVPPAATLLWLGLTILDQDRTIVAEQARNRREAMVRGVAGSLEQALVEASRHMTNGPVPEGMTRLTIDADGVRAEPAARAAWLPITRTVRPAVDDRFLDNERLEFGGHELEALAQYQRSLAASGEVRAGSLVRIARIHQRRRQWNDALRAYADLQRMTRVTIAGSPVDLQARRQTCTVLFLADRMAELARCAASLESDLIAGRWRIDAEAWALTAADLARWLGRPVEASVPQRAVSMAAEAAARLPPPTGDAILRTVVGSGETATTLLRRRSGADTAVLILTQPTLDEWARIALAGAPDVASVVIVAPDGQRLAGSGAAVDQATEMLPLQATGLPWALAIGARGGGVGEAAPGGRATLLGVGLAAILLLVGGGGYLLWRVMQRELEVSRLQTEFVSAVSHEFRTPLTSLRHMTELLTEGDDLPGEQRTAFYEALERDTGRLQRLVESLLDFSRVQDGRRPYDLQPIDAGAFASDVVTEFRAALDAPGTTIGLEVARDEALAIRADRTALASALWNLLDNAVKYASDRPVVHVGVHRNGAGIVIDVRDEGPGIPRDEQQEIFGRFVRGADATRRGIRGTGLGLAMVAHIVAAHGGTVGITSEPGVGSTFTMVLPAESAH